MTNLKPYDISKRRVLEAYWRVKANRGAAGIDGESLEMFEANLTGNLYKLWNRLSSGSYFPPPVRQVEIPKKNGGVRILGVPTVADRIAQQVAVTRIGGDLFGGVAPLYWTLHSAPEESSSCVNPVSRKWRGGMRRSFGSKWSSWYEPDGNRR